MATHTLGTTSDTALTAVTWLPGAGSGISAADMATIANGIWRQSAIGTSTPQIVPGAFAPNGLLFLPENRGVIQLHPGDVVGLDTTAGWPIVVSKYAIGIGSSLWDFV